MKQIKKYAIILLLILTLFVFSGCSTPVEETKKFLVNIDYNTGIEDGSILVEEGSTIVVHDIVENEGYNFIGWYLDKELTISLTDDYKVNENTTIYAKWEKAKYDVLFYVGDEIYDSQKVEHDGYIQDPGIPTRRGYKFLYWSNNEAGTSRFLVNKKVTENCKAYAKFEIQTFIVSYDLGYDAILTKDDLYRNYFTDFYNFMKDNTKVDFQKYNIENVEDFLKFCLDWNANGKDSFYGVGDAFSNYYVTKNVGGTLEQQPETSFIGYCYKNQMYTEFLPHLIKFFAYWRTDEGYTGSSSDPDNTGNDFYASPWASLVDTCKFFYFTSKNLNDTYSWFQSQRVKDALDNVPGILKGFSSRYVTVETPDVLKEPKREGYTFLGWYDEEGNKITVCDQEMLLIAKWEKK